MKARKCFGDHGLSALLSEMRRIAISDELLAPFASDQSFD